MHRFLVPDWRRSGLIGLVAISAALSLQGQTTSSDAKAPTRQPRLIVTMIVDQFRYDYLQRFRADYTSGLKRLIYSGAVFTNARYEHVPTVTAVGHSTILSGATPAMSGIIANEWWDRSAEKRVTSVSDDATTLLGGSGAGSSPERLQQSTVGDELKLSGKGGKVLGISIKDRGAILPSGHMADGAYWFDARSGDFVSSNYYFAELPSWVRDFNKSQPAAKYIGQEWMGHKIARNDDLDASPFGNQLIQSFALAALAAEGLGKNPTKTDLLSVSYSSNDYVGHAMGPDSPEVRDMAGRVDKLIGELIRASEAQAGAGNVLFVFTADHGVAPVPELNRQRKMPGGRLNIAQERDAVEKALNARFGSAKWIADETDTSIYFNVMPASSGHDVSRTDIENVAAEALRALPHVFRVYTRTQLLNGELLTDPVGVRVRNGFHAGRSPDLTIVSDPYWITGAGGTTHGSPFSYDNHVPLIFLGPGVRPGRYDGNVMINDIAPTLATMLEIETPSGSVGRVLDEMLPNVPATPALVR
jgi:predicted AlkP superfamily pyrophosphatase or phosphodiesterase